MVYAKGLVDHQWSNYVRYDGMINYRGEKQPTLRHFLIRREIHTNERKHCGSHTDVIGVGHHIKMTCGTNV